MGTGRRLIREWGMPVLVGSAAFAALIMLASVDHRLASGIAGIILTVTIGALLFGKKR
jgi:hypothetical protein